MVATIMWIGLGLFFISCATAQVTESSGCPAVTTKSNLEIEKILGKWYGIKRYTNLGDQAKTCSGAIFEANSKGGFDAFAFGLDSNGQQLYVNGSLGASDSDDKSKLRGKLQTFSHDLPYWIIDTDYTNYHIGYTFFPDDCKSFTYVWVFTRMPLPSADLLEQTDEILKKNKIDKLPYEKINQENCPKDHYVN